MFHMMLGELNAHSSVTVGPLHINSVSPPIALVFFTCHLESLMLCHPRAPLCLQFVGNGMAPWL